MLWNREKRKKKDDGCDLDGCDLPGCDDLAGCGDLPGCDHVPGCDGCDGCGGCDLNLTVLSLMAVSAPNRPPRAAPTVAARVGMAAIHGYRRWLSPRLPTRCPHVPTCSGYGLQAVATYGLVTGSRLTAARIRRCDGTVPRGTLDPVPGAATR